VKNLTAFWLAQPASSSWHRPTRTRITGLDELHPAAARTFDELRRERAHSRKPDALDYQKPRVADPLAAGASPCAEEIA